MTNGRTGDELTEPVHDCRNGWMTRPDSDAPRLCPLCRDKSRRRIRPAREFFEPNPSERAYAAYVEQDDRERAELDERRRQSRGHNVESPVTLNE